MIYDSEGNSYQDSLQHAAGNADPTEGTSEGAKPVTPEGGKQTPKTLYIIRHGSTDMNNDTTTSQDFIRGWKDIPLNDQGRQEAKDTGDKLADMEKPTVMHHSDLDRAEETAGIIGKKIGVEPTPSRELRPWDLGYLTGKPTSEAIPIIKDYVENKPDERVPKGESFNEFKERAFRGVFNALRSGDSPVAIVTHHRLERLLEAWDKKGQPDDLSIDVNTFGQKGDPPAGIKILQIGSPEAQAMTHSAEKPNPAEDFIKAVEGLGIDLTPVHKPGTQPKDYLKELSQNPDILAKNIEQASNFNFAGIFGGRMTAGAKALAEQLEKRGMSEETIKRWSGLERGAEGMWRKEIDDSKAVFKADRPDLDGELGNMYHGTYRAGDLLKHDELFKSYPELKDMPVEITHFPSTYHGDYGEGKIRLNATLSDEQAKTTLIHEIQHAIQEKEGFSLGAMLPEERDQYKGFLLRKDKDVIQNLIDYIRKSDTPEKRANAIAGAKTLIKRADYGTYRAQAHEEEAFNTGTRLKMGKEERSRSLGKSTEKTPREEQIKYTKKSEPYL